MIGRPVGSGTSATADPPWAERDAPVPTRRSYPTRRRRSRPGSWAAETLTPARAPQIRGIGEDGARHGLVLSGRMMGMEQCRQVSVHMLDLLVRVAGRSAP